MSISQPKLPISPPGSLPLVDESQQTELKAVLVFDPTANAPAGAWKRMEQPFKDNNQVLNVMLATMTQLLTQILTELRVQTYFLKEGLDVNDDIETVREDLEST